MQDEWVFSSDLSFRFLKHLLSSTVSECKHFKLQSVIKFNM